MVYQKLKWKEMFSCLFKHVISDA